MHFEFSMPYIIEKEKAFLRFLPLLRELVVRDIKVRYRHSVLGLIWTVLNPLLMMVVITIVSAKYSKLSYLLFIWIFIILF